MADKSVIEPSKPAKADKPADKSETSLAAANAERTKILADMEKIVKRYGGFGNIPLNSEYWDLKNRLQMLDAQPTTDYSGDKLPDNDKAGNARSASARFGRVPSDEWPPRRENSNWSGIPPADKQDIEANANWPNKMAAGSPAVQDTTALSNPLAPPTRADDPNAPYGVNRTTDNRSENDNKTAYGSENPENLANDKKRFEDRKIENQEVKNKK